LRKAKLAELEKVPVRIVKFNDAEAIEAQCVENLQREDIHPLEVAFGFKSFLELGEPYNIADIAARGGTLNSRQDRRKLLSEARTAPPLMSGTIVSSSRTTSES
jgi:ParB family transcriptional regulator, chromosome partitioning protein